MTPAYGGLSVPPMDGQDKVKVVGKRKAPATPGGNKFRWNRSQRRKQRPSSVAPPMDLWLCCRSEMNGYRLLELLCSALCFFAIGCQSHIGYRGKGFRSPVAISVDEAIELRYAVANNIAYTAHRYSANSLFTTIEKDDNEMVTKLLKVGINPNARDEAHIPALCIAISLGRIQIVRNLLDFGADINIRDDQRGTPLMVAAYYGQSEIAALLLQHRAKVNLKAEHGYTALITAAVGSGGDRISFETGRLSSEAQRKEDLKIAEMLIQAGAKINTEGLDGMTALDEAETTQEITNDRRMVDLLLRHGAKRGKRKAN